MGYRFVRKCDLCSKEEDSRKWVHSWDDFMTKSAWDIMSEEKWFEDDNHWIEEGDTLVCPICKDKFAEWVRKQQYNHTTDN